MLTSYIDTHCHLYLPEFAEDLDEVMQRAANEGVAKFYLPAIDKETESELFVLEEKFPGKCFAMMGLHPCSVSENFQDGLRWVTEWFTRREFAAVGEIGLDFYWDKTFVKEQFIAFRTQIELALQYNKPIVIHSRDSLDDCIKIVQEYKQRNIRGVFHCFSGSHEQALNIIDTGFYLGIGGVITYKNAGLAEVLTRISLEHMVLETDAPYLTPAPFRGKRNESSYLKYIVEKLALVTNKTAHEVGEITTRNAENIFSN